MGNGLTRRQLLRRAAAAGAAVTLPAALVACGSDQAQPEPPAPAEPPPPDPAPPSPPPVPPPPPEPGVVFTISNWPLYIDIDEETEARPTIDQFEAALGIEVDYLEEINDNEEFFAEFQQPLRDGMGIDRDLVVLSDWMAAKMIARGFVLPYDASLVPNAANVHQVLASPSWDAGRQFSLPWQSGLSGIGFDSNRFGPGGPSVTELLEDPALQGRVTVLDQMQDTLGLIMLDNGDDPAAVDEASFARALDRLRAAIDSGQILTATGNEYVDLLLSGDALASFAWSGDMVQLDLDVSGADLEDLDLDLEEFEEDANSLEFVIPSTGGMIWSDNMLIPTGGNVELASRFMNFVYEPSIAAQIGAYVNFTSPVQGAAEAAAAVDSPLAANELIFPTSGTLENVHLFDVAAADDGNLRRRFARALGA